MARRETKEIKRIKALLTNANVDEDKINVLMPTIEHVVWMKLKLDESRELVGDSSVAIEYNNGGGQTGIRENPVFKAYQNLFKVYIQGLKIILDAVPQQAADLEIQNAKEQKTVLELVREKHKVG